MKAKKVLHQAAHCSTAENMKKNVIDGKLNSTKEII